MHLVIGVQSQTEEGRGEEAGGDERKRRVVVTARMKCQNSYIRYEVAAIVA